MVVFNEIITKHLQTSVGIVSILTEDKKYENFEDTWVFLQKLKMHMGNFLEVEDTYG